MSDKTLVETLEIWLASRLRQVHTILPGRIEKYYGHLQRKARVKPLLKLRVPGRDPLDIPPIDNVPVVFPGSSKFKFVFPLTKGDGCLILFSEEGIGAFLKGKIDMPSDSLARFALTDAICIPGLWSFPNVPQTGQSEIVVEDSGAVKVKGTEVVLNTGTLGVARTTDSVLSNPTDDPVFFTWATAVSAALLALTGGSFVTPTPVTLASKITGGSTTVKAG